MSVNNITSKILRDAEGRKESILAAAEVKKLLLPKNLKQKF